MRSTQRVCFFLGVSSDLPSGSLLLHHLRTLRYWACITRFPLGVLSRGFQCAPMGSSPIHLCCRGDALWTSEHARNCPPVNGKHALQDAPTQH